MRMEQQHNQQHRGQDSRNQPKQPTYLNHGVESLVAQDSPDDPEAAARLAPKRGSRR